MLDDSNLSKFTSAHPHVLFSVQSLFYWSLLLICLYPQNANELYFQEECHLYRMYISAVFSSAFLSALSAMCWQPWPMIAMWPSVSPCCTQWSCSLKCVLCWFLVHMCWGLLEPWSTQGIWYSWFFVIPTLLAIICVTFSHSSSSPAAALMPRRLWFLLLWEQLSYYLASLSSFLMLWFFSISFMYHHLKVGPKPWVPWVPHYNS